MQRIITYTILSGDSETSVLSFLRKNGFSKHILTTMKRAEHAILLNGHPAFGRTVLKEGDVLVPEEAGDGAESSIIPVPLPLDILYEDEDILVLNKPADMPVHPSAGNYENTLANGVAWYYKQQGENFVYRCINRLDRDTTGVLVLAKNPLSGALLSAQMKQRQIRRTYLALTDGIPPEKGTVSAPIARMDDSVITREVNWEHGETAVTHYERLAVSNGYSLVELHLDTGRTHQIRVHMALFSVGILPPHHKKNSTFSGPCTGRFPESICRKKPVKINKHKKTAALCALHSLHTDSCFAISVNYLFFS